MKYIQQLINLSNLYANDKGYYEEKLADISPPTDTEYHWTIFNTHNLDAGSLLIIWQGIDKKLKGPERPPAPTPVPPKQDPKCG